MKGKRIKLPVTNEELRAEVAEGESVISLAAKYNCSTSVINRRLVEKTRYEKLDLETASGLEIITLTDAMQVTGLSRFLLTKLAKSGEIKYRQVGNRFMFQLKDVYKIIGIDLDKSANVKYTEMDILKENQEKSDSIEHIVINLVEEVRTLKKSVMNENKESYDREIINALKIINNSQNQMNETILQINEKQNNMTKELGDINKEIDNINNRYNSVKSAPVKIKPNSLEKFGGR